MLPANRLRLILGRCLHGVPRPAPAPLETDGDLHDYILKNYVREASTNERLTDLVLSVSSLGIASREDWLRLKKICFAHLPDLSCRGVNRIFGLLVEHDACGHVECVRIQDKLAQMNFSKSLRDHECLQALRSIINVGSRLSSSFMPHALEALQKLVKDSQAELLPQLSYTLGRIITSKENKGIPTEVQNALFSELLTRVESMDYMLLSLSEIVYLFWAVTAFCSSISAVRPRYLRASEAIITRGIQREEVKNFQPRDLLLLLCSLCPLFSLSNVGSLVLPTQEEGLLVGIATDGFVPNQFSEGFYEHLVATLDVVVFSLVERAARGKMQNSRVVTVVLEMITCSGATKVLKNAQILLHLLLRILMYDGKDAWFTTPKNLDTCSEGEVRPPLVDSFIFDERVDLLDILTTRLSPSVVPSVALRGLERVTIKEIIAVIEALANANLSTRFKNLYMEGCLRKLPRALSGASREDFFRIVDAVVKLRVKDGAILRAVQNRGQELGVGNPLLEDDSVNEGARHKQKSRGPSKEDWDADEISLVICEKVLSFLEEKKQCVDDVPELLETLGLRRGLGSARVEHCVPIIKVLSKCHRPISEEESYRRVLGSIFRRIGTEPSLRLMLSLITNGARAGVARSALVDSISWVGSRLLEGDLTKTEVKDVATYIVVAHELDCLDTVDHPHLIGSLHRKNALDSLSPHTAGYLFGALCALGVDDRRLLKQLLNVVQFWCSEVVMTKEWTEEDWKASLVLVHALWTSSSEVVKEELLQVAQELVPVMLRQGMEDMKCEYSLNVATAAATVIIGSDGDGIPVTRFQEGTHTEFHTKFLQLVASLFSQDGLTFSLSNAGALLGTGSVFPVIHQCDNVVCSMVIAHAVQRVSQTGNISSKRLAPLGVSLWRYCLRHLEKAQTADNALMTAVAFAIRFGASSQAFDRFMSALMEKENGTNMLVVCSIADGLVRTGKRRSMATQFVAYFAQKSCLDKLPTVALLSLINFFTRDAERVALGLTRAEMLTALVWSSLSLKIERLPHTHKLWGLVESVPLESAPVLLKHIGESKLISESSLVELVKPISLIVAWRPDAATGSAVAEFLHKVKASVDDRQRHLPNADPTAGELQQMISKRLQ
ncbi:hypothetical protein DQ04_01621000 [Trypanosoma grayi]|uniref:hypothetical protein n=1 Tax=Trypanosoma grayi TaxID=71804 RepID=UPI0004F43801|nr:hypothetical protein DQ04_01621000 [Trypanosoma grayi]KEG12547.1 hypothetical protein DQ04_01621000 [Trypanosoma grayi]